MKNYCFIIEYIGTKYSGFQRQKNGLSIQEVLENAIFLATNNKAQVTPSGRTDSGVHALGQVVNCFLDTNIPVDKLSVVINFHLPPDIRVKNCFIVDDSFNSRKSAKKKTYIYRIYTGETYSVFDEGRVLNYPYKLDFDLMKKAAKKFEGEHDFRAFARSNSSVKTTTRKIFSSYFTKDFDYLTYHVTGNGFLYNMVRIIVGTLLEVGRHKKNIFDIERLLNGESRVKSGQTMPPHALYLESVEYK